jgi:tol-pal system protein YbgF
MTDQSAPFTKWARLAAIVAAAGLLFATDASAQRRQQPAPPPAAVVADQQQDRIEELEAQLRDATAQNEDLQHQLMEAQREITRLRGMVGELAGVNQSLQAGQTPPADPNASPPSSAGPSGAPLAGGNDQRSDNGNLNDAQVRTSGTLGTLAQNELPPPGPAPADPVQVYNDARGLLVGGKYADAEIAFQQYLQQFPDAQNAPDARFWLAYTLLARNNYQDAASNFVDYLQHNRTAARAPEAQVRLGMALAGMGQTQQACAAFADVTRRYPNASRAVRDLATRESNAARCAA